MIFTRFSFFFSSSLAARAMDLQGVSFNLFKKPDQTN